MHRLLGSTDLRPQQRTTCAFIGTELVLMLRRNGGFFDYDPARLAEGLHLSSVHYLHTQIRYLAQAGVLERQIYFVINNKTGQPEKRYRLRFPENLPVLLQEADW
ncbi:MAG: hypothetical protein DCO99_03525 [Synechococcus sp. XM-24]|nr:MAG: hypothetical protein DCO99_03525 [Synechococcus sp. XM-24]